MKLIKTLVKVIAASFLGVIIFWILAFLYYPQIAPYGQKTNQNREYRIYFLMGMDVEKESSTERLIAFLNEQYLLKPYRGVKELYFSAWQIIDDDYPTKDIYAHIWIKPYNNRNLISMWSYGDEYVNAIFSKSKFEKKAESELKITSPYIDPIGLYQFDNIYYYTYNNRKENQKNTKSLPIYFPFLIDEKQFIFITMILDWGFR